MPADGVVVWGASSVNEAMITGESLPVSKAEGSEVIGGTVNQDGVLHVRANRVGADTTLAYIARLVQDSQASKAPIQGLSDVVAGGWESARVAECRLLNWFIIRRAA